MGQNLGRKFDPLFASYFFPPKTKEKTWNLAISGLLWLRRQDSNLRPPGYELLWGSNPLQCNGFSHILPPKIGEKPKAGQVCSSAQKRTFTEMGRNLGQSWFGCIKKWYAETKKRIFLLCMILDSVKPSPRSVVLYLPSNTKSTHINLLSIWSFFAYLCCWTTRQPHAMIAPNKTRVHYKW